MEALVKGCLEGVEQMLEYLLEEAKAGRKQVSFNELEELLASMRVAHETVIELVK